MGKSKGGKGADKTGKKVIAPKCTCDHPFECACSNRPERPSRGHRWDPEAQEWGGKGHKQKGGSGQISQKAVEAQTTSLGKTTIAQWQQLPSHLLDEVTKKEGRPRAKYKSIGHYKFRIIIQDAKAARRGTEHDLILVPAEACGNEEQAKEEAALLALLHLTPSIPHERKLPEPYKTTWIHATKAAKEAKKNKPRGKPNSADESKQAGGPRQMGSTSTGSGAGGPRQMGPTSTGGGGGAKASTNLTLGNTFVSLAERRKQQDMKRQVRNARIQKHEAVRVANRDHQVFLSAQIRKRIETLLRGEAVQWEEETRDDENDEDEPEDDLKAYIVERLHSEGFSKSQAKTSYSQLKSEVLVDIGEDQWDGVYDECLQWLCIHLDEDQLPEGFDPRGRTLDVIVNQDSNKPGRQEGASPEVQQVASKYGVTIAEAKTLLKMADDSSIDQVLWKALCSKAATALSSSDEGSDKDENVEIARDELEALEAIFLPEECQIHRQNGTTSVVISLPSEDNAHKLQMKIVTRDGVYPAVHVDQVLIYGVWSKPVGVAVHVKLIQFLSDLPLSEPMMYEIFGQVQSLLQEAADGELNTMSLALSSNGKTETKSKPQGKPLPEKSSARTLVAPKLRRPRQRASFWSTPPKKTPKATAFPQLETKIRHQRESLPAAKARGDFLNAMQECLKTGRVVLVTGDTGCGKVGSMVLMSWLSFIL